jgi:hypothetical protein
MELFVLYVHPLVSIMNKRRKKNPNEIEKKESIITSFAFSLQKTSDDVYYRF